MVQNPSLGGPESIYSPFLQFLGDVEKSLFFDVAQGCHKIDKNRSLERPGGPRAPRRIDGGGGVESPGVPRPGAIIKDYRQNMDCKDRARCLTRRWAVGPANLFSTPAPSKFRGSEDLVYHSSGGSSCLGCPMEGACEVLGRLWDSLWGLDGPPGGLGGVWGALWARLGGS